MKKVTKANFVIIGLFLIEGVPTLQCMKLLTVEQSHVANWVNEINQQMQNLCYVQH